MNDSSENEVTVIPEVTLWRYGAVTMPRGTKPFADAATAIDETANHQNSAFSGPLQVGTFKSNWIKLRNLVQDDVLGTTHRNLSRAASTLAKYAQDMVGKDDDNKRILDDAIAETNSSEFEADHPPAPYDPPPPSDDSDVPGNPRYAA